MLLKVQLRNNLMEVEAGEKNQRRGLRINIGDFDEMVCPPLQDYENCVKKKRDVK